MPALQKHAAPGQASTRQLGASNVACRLTKNDAPARVPCTMLSCAPARPTLCAALQTGTSDLGCAGGGYRGGSRARLCFRPARLKCMPNGGPPWFSQRLLVHSSCLLPQLPCKNFLPLESPTDRRQQLAPGRGWQAVPGLCTRLLAAFSCLRSMNAADSRGRASKQASQLAWAI